METSQDERIKRAAAFIDQTQRITGKPMTVEKLEEAIRRMITTELLPDPTDGRKAP